MSFRTHAPRVGLKNDLPRLILTVLEDDSDEEGAAQLDAANDQIERGKWILSGRSRLRGKC